MATSALKTWASARAGQATKTPAEVKSPLPKIAVEKKPERAPKAKLPPRVWHNDHAANDLPKETWHEHYDKHPDEGGKPTEARKALVHDPIITKAFQGKTPVAKGEQKIAIMTMGAPASGKSSGLNGIDTSKFVVVDPDSIKGKLPEYKKATQDRNNTYKGAAAMAHEESSALAKQITKKAIEEGHHVLIDGTGANQASFLKKLKELKENGYHVHVIGSHLDVGQGLERARVRSGSEGRHVPEEVIKEAYHSVPKNFEAISKAADSFHFMDNRGKESKQVWSKDEDGEHAHDPHFVAQFKAAHWGETPSKAPKDQAEQLRLLKEGRKKS